MKSQPTTTLSLILAAAFSLGFIPTKSEAQFYDLIKAHKGDCGETFTKAADHFRKSLISIQALKKQATVSDSVSALISKSNHPTGFVHRNSHLFRPIPVRTQWLS